MAAFEEGQDVAVRGILTGRQRLRLPSEVTLTLAADTNDAVVTGIGAATKIVVYDVAGGHKLTGVIAGSLGDEITIQYRYDAVGVTVITARDPASSSGNRFVMAGNVTLKPYQSISFRYGQDSAGFGWYPVDDRFGTAAAHDASEFALAFTDTGILVTGGAIGGVAIVPNVVVSEVRGMALGAYAYASGSCQLWVYPAPPGSTTFALDVQKISFAANSPSVPGSGNSIVASAPPSITGGSGFVTASVSQSTWTGALAKGDMLTVVPTINTAGVQWYTLFIPARRTL